MSEDKSDFVSDRTVRHKRKAKVQDPAIAKARRRRHLRRRLMLWSLPLAIALLLVSAKLISQHVIAQTALSQYSQTEYEGSLNTSGQLKFVNVVEPWKPFYNMGTNYLRLDALAEAQEQFHSALDLASPAEQCPIRANLAIAIEREGDLALEAEDVQTAVAKYQEALTVLEEADASCEFSTSNRSITDSDARITEKLEELQQQDEQPQDDGGDGSDSPGGESDGGSESQPDPDALDELENGLGDNQQDRQNDVEDEEGGYGQSQPDQPW
ncbi:hypothetical protein [Gulosibacter sp. ACHW.36C]|uniref:Tetratricopeptide repeat protein n=1 Tax=Gulosibacter sediminis TaxID=1729695 RepID=A0ABY4MZQ8_9MICO|nr:hypothetical protein [Gulosibacter sediminis]UQN15935.1 hypothetical protein M3M28_05665 [Gulosibacter sediminis]